MPKWGHCNDAWVVALFAAIALGAIGGCGDRAPSPRPRDGKTVDSAATRNRELPPEIDTTVVALGNEPFWNVRVTALEIVYRDPEHQDGYRFPPVAAVVEGSARVYRTRRDLPAGDPGPRTLELRIESGACSDGMSDRQYTMTAALEIGGETFTGCAMFEGSAQALMRP